MTSLTAGYINKLSPGVRALFVTWEVEAEVNNGGFHQCSMPPGTKLDL